MTTIQVVTLITVLVLGAVMGSFACCQAWRLRYRETKRKDLGKWSVCLHCHHRLAWWENIPIISWLFLRGKCHHCGKQIGKMEFISELSLLIIFGLTLWFFWNRLWLNNNVDMLSFFAFIVMLVELTVMWIILLYDARWGVMPTRLLLLSIALAVVYRALLGVEDWFSLLAGVAILAGIYLFLYLASREKLVGSGDWLLCLAIAIILGNWWLALVELFVANTLGSITMLPYAIKTKNRTIHFAPFLIVGFLLVFLFQDVLRSFLAF